MESFDLLKEIIVFSANKEKFTNRQNRKILKYYRKKLNDIIGDELSQTIDEIKSKISKDEIESNISE